MNKLIKTLLPVLLFAILFCSPLLAQNLSTGNTWVGKTFSNKTPNVDEQRILRQADMQYRLGDLEEAYFSLEEAYALNPTSVQILLRRATLKQILGMENEAEADFKKAQDLNPYAADLFGFTHSGNLINILSSEPQSALSNLPVNRRLDYYYGVIDHRIMESESVSDEIRFINDIVVALEENKLPTAKEKTDSLLLSFPNSALGYDLQGTILFREGEYDAAEVAFNKAVKLKPDFAIAWYNLSRVEAKNGNLSIAKTHLNKAIELKSDLTKAYFDRALLNKKQGNPKAALADYDKVIEMRGKFYPEAYLNRGLTKKILGDFQGALTDINTVVENDEFENPEPLINRGNLHMVLGLTERAIEDYTEAILLDENNANAFYNRGVAFLILLDNTSACSDLERSERLGFAEAKEILSYFCGF